MVLVWKERFNTAGVLKKYLNNTRVKLVNTKKQKSLSLPPDIIVGGITLKS